MCRKFELFVILYCPFGVDLLIYRYLFFSGGSLLVCAIGLKMVRSSFSDSSKQCILVIWTVLFFEFDYQKSSEGFPIDYFIMSIVLTKVGRS